MTEKEQVQQIVKKYNKSIADLSENASAKEFKTVMNYVADEANRNAKVIFKGSNNIFLCTKDSKSIL